MRSNTEFRTGRYKVIDILCMIGKRVCTARKAFFFLPDSIKYREGTREVRNPMLTKKKPTLGTSINII